LDHDYSKEQELEFFPISRRVNNSRYDAADALEPATPDELLVQGELGL
jgi:hypothetical protein